MCGCLLSGTDSSVHCIWHDLSLGRSFVSPFGSALEEARGSLDKKTLRSIMFGYHYLFLFSVFSIRIIGSAIYIVVFCLLNFVCCLFLMPWLL